MICCNFLDIVIREKGFLNKAFSTCIQNFLCRPFNGITAAHDYFQVWAVYHEKMINSFPIHIRQQNIQDGQVNGAMKGFRNRQRFSAGPGF